MTKQEFIQKLGQELGVSSAKLTDNAALASFPGWDSMGRVAVVAMLDTELSFDAPQGALERCVTVGDLVALVSHRLLE